MKQNIFKGVITALITPFKSNQIDFDAFDNLINRQIDAGIKAIVVGGSTGEGNLLSDSEYYELIKAAAKIADDKAAIIAGIASAGTAEAISKIRKLADCNLQGIMATTPHYTRPMQNGLYEHFRQIHDATDLPVMIYENPGRTGTYITDETIIRLSHLDRIMALKDAGSDIKRPLRLLNKVASGFNMLCGNDDMALAYNAHGGDGFVSTVSNIVPDLCLEMQNAWQTKDLSQALKIQQKLLPLYEALELECNPIALKYVIHKLGLCENNLRLPLTTAAETTRNKIDAVLTDYL